MAFQRLTVERSPNLAWFGAFFLIALYGLMQATRDLDWLWLVGGGFGGYCVFRGLYGPWWRELEIDTEACKLKLGTGQVVPLDGLGAITITGRHLRADKLDMALYYSPFPRDLELRRAALAEMLNVTGRRRLYRLRRLAYHRSWSLFVFTLVGFALLAFAAGEKMLYGDVDDLEFQLLALAGVALCFLWFRRALFGTLTKEQLYVDATAGVVQLPDGRIKPLDELGALSIVDRRDPYRGRRHTLMNYDLQAANIDGILFTDFDKLRTQLRLDALSTAVLQSALRRVLEAPVIEGDAFRSGLDPKREVARLAGDSPYKAAALRALTRDPDPTIRERARALV